MALFEFPQEDLLWAALHDPLHWSIEHRHDETDVIHENGSCLHIRYQGLDSGPLERGAHILTRGLFNDPGKVASHFPFQTLHLKQERMTLPLWHEVLAPLVRGDNARITTMIRCLAIRHDPVGAERWGAIWHSNDQTLVLSPRHPSHGTDPLIIPLPSWMNVGPVHLPRWLSGRRSPNILLNYCINNSLPASSMHQRLLDRQRAAEMPDIQDPASAAYWGFN